MFEEVVRDLSHSFIVQFFSIFTTFVSLVLRALRLDVDVEVSPKSKKLYLIIPAIDHQMVIIFFKIWIWEIFRCFNHCAKCIWLS